MADGVCDQFRGQQAQVVTQERAEGVRQRFGDGVAGPPYGGGVGREVPVSGYHRDFGHDELRCCYEGCGNRRWPAALVVGTPVPGQAGVCSRGALPELLCVSVRDTDSRAASGKFPTRSREFTTERSGLPPSATTRPLPLMEGIPMPPRTTPTERQKRLGSELRRIRTVSGMSAEFAAGLLGVDQGKKSNIESGVAGPSVPTACAPWHCNCRYRRLNGWWRHRGRVSGASGDLELPQACQPRRGCRRAPPVYHHEAELAQASRHGGRTAAEVAALRKSPVA
ncbi:hypothetical protein SALBM217S_10214 [Streptomyces griseoloalbus]